MIHPKQVALVLRRQTAFKELDVVTMNGRLDNNALRHKNTAFTQKVLYNPSKRFKIESTSGSNERITFITVHQMKLYRKKEGAWRKRFLFGLDC